MVYFATSSALTYGYFFLLRIHSYEYDMMKRERVLDVRDANQRYLIASSYPGEDLSTSDDDFLFTGLEDFITLELMVSRHLQVV